MIDVYFALGLFLLNALSFFSIGLVYNCKLIVFLKYLEEKYPRIYAQFDFMGFSYNTFKMVPFVFDKKKYKDATIMSTKKLFKKLVLVLLYNSLLMVFAGLYLFLRLSFFA